MSREVDYDSEWEYQVHMSELPEHELISLMEATMTEIIIDVDKQIDRKLQMFYGAIKSEIVLRMSTN